jgi:chromate transporter
MVYTALSMPNNRSALAEVVVVFGRLGATAFGGPAAHVALQEEECVRRRGWIDHRRFLDLLAATNVIPGPNSTEMAMHLGRVRAGWPGLVGGGVAFILPSAVLATALAVAYARMDRLPAMDLVFETLRPAVVAVVLQALVQFARSALTNVPTVAVAVLAAAAALAGVGEVTVVLAAVCAGLVPRGRTRLRAVPLLELGLVFLKIGATLFGSGYVLVAYLRAENAAHGWLSDRALLDAVAIGQLTPGPVSTAATVVGYLVAGMPGAIVATVAIFLPAFVLVATTGPIVERWSARPAARRTLDVVNAAVVGLITAVLIRLTPTALGTPLQIVVALAAFAWLRWRPAGSTAVLLGTLALGLVRALFGR